MISHNGTDNYVSDFIMYSDNYSNSLSFSGNTATCVSYVSGYINVTSKIIIEQFLEKRVSLINWCIIEHWSKQINHYTGFLNNKKHNIDSGTYRLTTVFRVFSGTNYEVIKKQSSYITIC